MIISSAILNIVAQTVVGLLGVILAYCLIFIASEFVSELRHSLTLITWKNILQRIPIIILIIIVSIVIGWAIDRTVQIYFPELYWDAGVLP